MKQSMLYRLNGLVDRRTRMGFVLGLLLLVLVACGGRQPATSALTEEQVMEIGAAAMQGFGTGDYATYTEHWSTDMKAAIKEADFLAFREQIIQQYGNYQSITQMEQVPAQNPGIVRWVFTCAFEKGTWQFAFAFEEGGDEIVGAFAEAIAQSN